MGVQGAGALPAGVRNCRRRCYPLVADLVASAENKRFPSSQAAARECATAAMGSPLTLPRSGSQAAAA
eukprot:7284058-Alexandrium_andersonii.AAC.1